MIPLPYQHDMHEVNIEINDGLYSENEIRAVHVVKEGNADVTYLTTLCEDCIKYTRSYGILVKEKYLMIEQRK